MVKKKVCEWVIKRFGFTDDIYEAGYIMPDGKLINLSSGGTGRLDYNHMAVSYEKGSPFGHMREFMDECKAVRIQIMRDEYAHGEMINKPTDEQLQVLGGVIQDCMDEGIKEFTFDRTTKFGRPLCAYDSNDEFHRVSNPLGKFVAKCFK